jgi:type II secretion system protein N
MNRIVRILVYVAWAILSLLVFIYLTFPTDVLRDAAKVQIEAGLGGSYEVLIDEASLAGLTGVTLEGLRLLPRAGLAATPEATEGGGGDGGPGGGAPRLTLPTLIDEATITVNPLTLGRPVPELDFDLRLGQGSIYGSVTPDAGGTGAYRVQVNIDNVALLPNLGILSNALGARMSGIVTGQAELRYGRSPEGRPVLSGGALTMVIQSLVRGPGPLSILYLETPTRMGTLEVGATLEGSDLNIQTFQATGGQDFEMQVGGRINVRSPLAETTLYLTAHLGFAPEWMVENGLTGAFEADPTLRAACADNQCALRLQGRVADGVRPEPLRR